MASQQGWPKVQLIVRVVLIKCSASFTRESSIRTKFTGAGLLLALVSTLVATPSGAATQQTTFNVTANVSVACAVSAANLAFGSYSAGTTTALDAQTNISVDCTAGANWELGLDKGLHGASTAARAMANDTAASILLNYSIFSDPARTVNWGNNTGVDTVTGVGTGVVQDIGAYGRIPARQTTATAGGYSDTITATITF